MSSELHQQIRVSQRIARNPLFRFGMICGVVACIAEMIILVFDEVTADQPDWSELGAGLFLWIVLLLFIVKWWTYVADYAAKRTSFRERTRDTWHFSILIGLFFAAFLPWPYGVVVGVGTTAILFWWGMRDAANLRHPVPRKPE